MIRFRRKTGTHRCPLLLSERAVGGKSRPTTCLRTQPYVLRPCGDAQGIERANVSKTPRVGANAPAVRTVLSFLEGFVPSQREEQRT